MAGARERTRPMAALWRVLTVPGFVAALWVAQLLFARVISLFPRQSAKAAMGPHRWFDPVHHLRAVIELFAVHPGVAAAAELALAGSTLAAMTFSVLAAPAIVSRLSGQGRAAELGRATGQFLGAVAVQSLYALFARALCLSIGLGSLAALGPAGLALAVPLWVLPVLGLDRARVAVVVEQHRPYHPMTYLRGLFEVLRRPLWWASGALITALQVAVGLVAMGLVTSGALGEGGIWIARVGGLAAIALGLWRVSLAIDATA